MDIDQLFQERHGLIHPAQLGQAESPAVLRLKMQARF